MFSETRGFWQRCGEGSERGSVIPLLAIIMLAVAMAGLLIGVTARHYRKVAQVQWAADSAALAIAAEGPDEFGADTGRRIAAANGAQLVSVMTSPGLVGSAGPYLSVVVVVEVEADGITARAAASRVAADVSPDYGQN